MSPDRISAVTDAVVAVYLALSVLPDGTRDILGRLDRADRRREILVEGLHRLEDARRSSLESVGCKDRKQVAAALRAIYTAPSAEAAAHALETFDQIPWGTRFPMIGKGRTSAINHTPHTKT